MTKVVHSSSSEANFRKILVLVNGCPQQSPFYSLSYKDVAKCSENYCKFNQKLSSRKNSSGSYICWMLQGIQKGRCCLRGSEGKETCDSSAVRILALLFPPSPFIEVPLIFRGPRQHSVCDENP